MLIVKLGGSVITDKSSYRSFRKDVTGKVIEVLAGLDEQLILVHGAGSFGHIKAKEYGLPGKVNRKTLTGFAVVHQDVMRLNLMIMDMLLSAGMDAITVSPASTFSSRSSYTQLSRLADNGFTVVSHGDCYLSGNYVRIVSGDRIVKDLAAKYKPSKVIFLSDVDGVYNRNPKLHADAALISSLEDDIEFSGTVDDVTGGMEGKLSEMKKIAKYSNGVYLINGNNPERIRDIGKKSFIGTAIRYQKNSG